MKRSMRVACLEWARSFGPDKRPENTRIPGPLVAVGTAGLDPPPRTDSYVQHYSYTSPCLIFLRPLHTTGHATAGMPRSPSICAAWVAASSVSNRSEM